MFHRIALLALFVISMALPAYPAVYELTPSDDWYNLLTGTSLQPGDEVILHGGEYVSSGWVPLRHVGTAANPITIRAAEGERPIFKKTATYKNGLEIQGGQYLTLKGLEVTQCDSGIRIYNDGSRFSKFVTIEDCYVHDINGVAITANHENQTYEGIVLRGNHIHDTGGHGEGMYLGSNYNASQFFDGLIEGNYIHHTNGPNVSQGDGIEIKLGSYNNVVRDNVIHDTNYPGVIVYGTEGQGDRNIIERNAIWRTGDYAIQAASDAIIRNNLIFNAASGIGGHVHQGAIPGNLDIIHNTIIHDHGGMLISYTYTGALSGPLNIANNAMHHPSGMNAVAVANSVNMTHNVVAIDPTADFGDVTDKEAWPVEGSSLIGAGSPTYAVTDDFNGTPRNGNLDVGAYVYDPYGNSGWPVQEGFKEAPPARTMEYRILINGQDIETVHAGVVDPGSTFTLGVEVNIPDAWMGGSLYGGVLQASFGLEETATALEPTETLNGPLDQEPSGYWASSAISPMSNYRGEINVDGMDVFGQTVQIPPSDFEAYYDEFGAGPDVWDLICEGEFTWDGTASELTLVPGSYASHLIYHLTAVHPNGLLGDSVSFRVLDPGDSDGDGDVDAEDLATLGLNWNPGGTGATWSDADFDSDGDVDAEDLASLGLHWNPGGTIPEPASLGILSVGLLGLLKRRGRPADEN